MWRVVISNKNGFRSVTHQSEILTVKEKEILEKYDFSIISVTKMS